MCEAKQVLHLRPALVYEVTSNNIKEETLQGLYWRWGVKALYRIGIRTLVLEYTSYTVKI